MSDFVDFLPTIISILLYIHWSYKNMSFCAGIVRHRLSANKIIRFFKLKKLYEVTRFGSLEGTKNIMLFWFMTSKYSGPINLQDFLLLTCLTCFLMKVFWWKFPCQQKVFFKIKKQVQLSLPQQYLWRIGQFVEIIFFILDSKNPKQKVGTTQVITNNEFCQTVLSCSCLITINVFWLSLTSKATLVHWFV